MFTIDSIFDSIQYEIPTIEQTKLQKTILAYVKRPKIILHLKFVCWLYC